MSNCPLENMNEVENCVRVSARKRIMEHMCLIHMQCPVSQAEEASLPCAEADDEALQGVVP